MFDLTRGLRLAGLRVVVNPRGMGVVGPRVAIGGLEWPNPRPGVLWRGGRPELLLASSSCREGAV